MADHPLRPATHLRLGGPLPRQLPNGPRAHPEARGPRKDPPLFLLPHKVVGLSGISSRFQLLSQSPGQITHVLLTRAPLYSLPEGNFLVRLACVKHAASVRSEPGSNSPVYTEKLILYYLK